MARPGKIKVGDYIIFKDGQGLDDGELTLGKVLKMTPKNEITKLKYVAKIETWGGEPAFVKSLEIDENGEQCFWGPEGRDTFFCKLLRTEEEVKEEVARLKMLRKFIDEAISFAETAKKEFKQKGVKANG